MNQSKIQFVEIALLISYVFVFVVAIIAIVWGLNTVSDYIYERPEIQCVDGTVQQSDGTCLPQSR